MTPTNQRSSAFFISGNSALDLLNSVAAPRGTVIDWLDTGADLLDWLVEAGLCTPSEVQPFRDPSQARQLASTLQEVHALREALRDFVEATAGDSMLPMAHPTVDLINEILRAGTLSMQIAPLAGDQSRAGSAGDVPVLKTQFELRNPRDILPRVAEACARLICGADFTYVKNCEGPSCTLYFLDTSKNHKRRWCSMSVCGNRAKAAAHRKAHAAPS